MGLASLLVSNCLKDVGGILMIISHLIKNPSLSTTDGMIRLFELIKLGKNDCPEALTLILRNEFDWFEF